MKLKIFLPAIFLLLCTSCSLNNSDDPASESQREIEIYQWHLTNVSGGIAGVDIDFDMDIIIYVFSVDSNGNGTLSVQNNNDDNTLEDGLDTGVYAISIPAYDTNSILFVDGTEYGAIVTPNIESGEDLIIDQNITSTGTLSDGFKYTFKRKIITQTI
ncbi:hypothetical protein [Algibacter sp. 2305UL17-15]|uniref:hypothetical protein n=1 Tax=Algibacter sp. 2305UL17-15 TaxID=3231268 RepID=UPI00345AB68C